VVKTVGDFPKVSLQQARMVALEPLQETERLTFGEVARTFISEVLEVRYKDPNEAIASVTRDASALQSVRIDRLSRLQWVGSILEKHRTSPGAARRMLAVSKTFSRWLAVRGYLDHDVLAPVTLKVLGMTQYQPREVVLDDREIRQLLTSNWVHRPVLEFALRTGSRIREALGIVPDEVRNGVWYLPAARSKNGKAHKVPLPPAALALLSTPWRSNNYGTLHAWLRLQNLRWTPHDLRRTAATRMVEAGCHRDDVERVLNHSHRGIVQVYHRDDPSPQIGRALLVLEAELARIVKEGP